MTQQPGAARHARPGRPTVQHPSKEQRMPPVRIVHCPSCRRDRITKHVATARVHGKTVELVECTAPDCALVWAVRPDRTLVPAAA